MHFSLWLLGAALFCWPFCWVGFLGRLKFFRVMFGAKFPNCWGGRSLPQGLSVSFQQQEFNQHKGSRLLQTKLVYVLGQWLPQSGPMSCHCPHLLRLRMWSLSLLQFQPVHWGAPSAGSKWQVASNVRTLHMFHVGRGEGKPNQKLKQPKPKQMLARVVAALKGVVGECSYYTVWFWWRCFLLKWPLCCFVYWWKYIGKRPSQNLDIILQ